MSDINVIDHLTAPERFKTQTRLAQAAGVKPHTISEKRHTNALTHEQMRRILRVAPEMGVDVSPTDFFPEIGGGPDSVTLPVTSGAVSRNPDAEIPERAR